MCPAPTSPSANPHCREVMESALEAPNGVRVAFPTKEAAQAFRFRCYHTRTQEIRRSTKIYPPDSPNYGKSSFDILSLTIDPHLSGWCVTISKPSIHLLQLETF